MGWRIMVVLCCFAAVARAAEPVGLLSMVSGDVKIVRAGETTPVVARTADLISAGDRVQTGNASGATFLFCPESRTAKINADSEVEFAAAALNIKKGKLDDDRKIPSCKLPSNLALSAASKLQSGVLRLRGTNLLLRSPSRTSVAQQNPDFRWEPVENAKSYDVKLLDREEHILWKQTVTSTDVELPSSALQLAWGQKYWWRVTARDGEDTLVEAGSYFQVLPADQAQQAQASIADLQKLQQANPADNGPLFLLAFAYEENGMLDEAARVYEELSQRMGPQDWVQSRLNDLMGKLGWDRLETGAPK